MENQQEKELTPEEIAQKKEEMKQFYDDAIPYLESQSKYEKLLTEIEEARFKRASFQYQFAMMMDQMKGQEHEEEDDHDDFPVPPPAKKDRKLKKS